MIKDRTVVRFGSRRIAVGTSLMLLGMVGCGVGVVPKASDLGEQTGGHDGTENGGANGNEGGAPADNRGGSAGHVDSSSGGSVVRDGSANLGGSNVVQDAGPSVDLARNADAAAETRPGLLIIGQQPSGFYVATDPAQLGAPYLPPYTAAENAVAAICFGGGVVVASSALGVFLSTDGGKWERTMEGSFQASELSYAFGAFFLFSFDDLYRSVDGRQWVKRTGTGFAQHWHTSVTGSAGGKTWLAAFGDEWEIVAGQPNKAPPRWKWTWDGMTWNYLAIHRDDANADWQINGAAAGNDRFVGVGDSGHVVTFDGSNWATPRRDILKGSNAQSLLTGAIGFANGRFLVSAANAYAVSTDGVVWTTGTSNQLPRSMVWDGHQWIGIRCGNNGANDADVCTSPDGVKWTTAFLVTKLGPPWFTALAFGQLSAR